MKKCVLFIATTMLICNDAIKADTLEEGIAENYKGNHAHALKLLHPI